MVDRKFQSIVEELLDYAPKKDRELFIESRGQQLIGSAINLINLIKESYNHEIADDLTKRLLRAISSGDEDKFRRGIRNLRESIAPRKETA